jgi:hypothetical protein
MSREENLLVLKMLMSTAVSIVAMIISNGMQALSQLAIAGLLFG